MERRCGPRGGRHVYTRSELIIRLKEQFPDISPAEIRSLKKQDLCVRLGMPFIPVRPAVVPETEEKRCTNRPSRRFPNRYNREELVLLAKDRHPRYSKGFLRRLKIRDLCRLSRLVYHHIASNTTNPIVGRIIEPPVLSMPGSTGAVEDCITRGAKILLDHQVGLIQRLQDQRGVIAVHATGSGKTLSAVVASQCFLDNHPDGRVIVLAPASLVSNMEKELDAFGAMIRHRSRYIIMSFQTFMNRRKKRDRTLDCDHVHTMLIVDEAHNFRTEYKKVGRKYQGIMTRHVLQCAQNAEKVLLLTATPIVNRLEDIVPLLNMIREDAKNPNTLIKKSEFIKNKLDTGFLQQHIHNKFHFFQPADDRDRSVYPASTSEVVYLTMNPEYLKKYKEIEELHATEDNVYLFGDVNLKAFFNGVRRATNTLDRTVSCPSCSPKINWILDFMAAHDEKTIIYSQFLDMGSLAVFHRLPQEIQEKVGFITGDVPRVRRQDIVDRYNRGELMFLFLSKAGGEGLDLKGTRNIILLEPSWNMSAEQQVIGRGVRYMSHAHLPFSQRHVTIFRLLSIKPSDAEKLDEVMEKNLMTNPDGSLLSVDLMMHNLQKRKQADIDHYVGIIRANNE